MNKVLDVVNNSYLDWFVFTKKTALMQRLADLVRSGHHMYVAGVISSEKAGWFAGKQHYRYEVGQDRFASSRQRKSNRAVFRLLMLHVEGESDLRWWLLRTDCDIPTESKRETWRNALTDRIQLTGYELVRLTKIGQAKPSWTWRYSNDRYESLRESILRAIRNRRDDELRQLIHTIFRTPGFSGSRDQVKKLVDLIRQEWKRSRGCEKMPEIPKRLGYVRRLPDTGLKLSELGVKKRGKRKTK